MIVSFLLFAIASGLTAFVSGLVFGLSLPFALALYTLVGTLTLIVLPLTRLLIEVAVERWIMRSDYS